MGGLISSNVEQSQRVNATGVRVRNQFTIAGDRSLLDLQMSRPLDGEAELSRSVISPSQKFPMIV